MCHQQPAVSPRRTRTLVVVTRPEHQVVAASRREWTRTAALCFTVRRPPSALPRLAQRARSSSSAASPMTSWRCTFRPAVWTRAGESPRCGTGRPTGEAARRAMCSVSTHYLLCYAKLPALMVEEFFFVRICFHLFWFVRSIGDCDRKRVSWYRYVSTIRVGQLILLFYDAKLTFFLFKEVGGAVGLHNHYAWIAFKHWQIQFEHDLQDFWNQNYVPISHDWVGNDQFLQH